MTDTFKVALCHDGRWAVHTQGDVVAYVGQGNEQAKAYMIANALNASTVLIPVNPHGVKPGFHTRPDIIRLLRMHCRNHAAVHFIADKMMTGGS